MENILTKCEKGSESSLKCEKICSYGQRRNISLLKTAHWYGQSIFDNYLFVRAENSKT